MTSAEMAQLAENGLNTVHIYAEKRLDNLPVGASAENCDYLIEEAQKNGMLVVLTVGEMNHDPDSFERDAQFIYEFWEFYAERYKDRENVIFEICNEVPLAYHIAEVQANAYQIIRKHAPNTMVLFYSLAMTDNIEHFLPYLEETEARIDEASLWDNAALAFHGYESQEDLKGEAHFRNVIHTLTRGGYPLINTELPNRFEQSGYPDTALLRVCEEENISWLSFVFWTRITEPSYWRGQLDAAGIAWKPDYGNWPVPEMRYPFAKQRIWETAASTPLEYVQEYRGISYILKNGDFLDIPDLHFGAREPHALCVTVKSEGTGVLTVHQGNVNGRIIGTCSIPDTHGEYTEVTCAVDSGIIEGDSLYFSYTSEDGGQIYFRDWRFSLPDQALYSNPYINKVAAAEAPFQSGELKRVPCTDTEADVLLQVSGITDNSYLLYDFVGFQGKDVSMHICAMPLAGGTLTVYAGDRKLEYFELGSCEITGEPGQWQEYSFTLHQSRILMYDPHLQYWDLQLIFTGAEGVELFAIREFWFDTSNESYAE
ncbi:cellulase family glycosylhydrolase [Eubacteriales bacterium OttesenSCG-928-N13]|nr:cellulase family glycosylhydrolase [Eubacteriales bacterium OttesenSCG-928-N13]